MPLQPWASMQGDNRNSQQSLRGSARDAATIRLRRVTQTSVAVAVALAGGFAALAAGSTHPAKKSAPSNQATTTITASASTAAPAPPLVPAQAGKPTTHTPAPSPPAVAPAPATTAPVVVSGGS